MSEWRVLKHERQEQADNSFRSAYVEIGNLESTYTYGAPSAQALGDEYGEGDYLMLDEGRSDFKRLVIELEKVDPRYCEVDVVVPF